MSRICLKCSSRAPLPILLFMPLDRQALPQRLILASAPFPPAPSCSISLLLHLYVDRPHKREFFSRLKVIYLPACQIRERHFIIKVLRQFCATEIARMPCWRTLADGKKLGRLSAASSFLSIEARCSGVGQSLISAANHKASDVCRNSTQVQARRGSSISQSRGCPPLLKRERKRAMKSDRSQRNPA